MHHRSADGDADPPFDQRRVWLAIRERHDPVFEPERPDQRHAQPSRRVLMPMEADLRVLRRLVVGEEAYLTAHEHPRA